MDSFLSGNSFNSNTMLEKTGRSKHRLESMMYDHRLDTLKNCDILFHNTVSQFIVALIVSQHITIYCIIVPVS